MSRKVPNLDWKYKAFHDHCTRRRPVGKVTGVMSPNPTVVTVTNAHQMPSM